MRPRTCLLAALPLAALAIAGCGGGGGDGSTAAAPVVATTPITTLTKDELISQGDAICAEVNAAVGTVSSTSTDSSGQVGQDADLYTGMVDSLKGLGTPDDTAGYSDFISAADSLSQAESDAKLAAERGDSAALASAQSSASSALASFQAAAQAYGFKDCSQGPSAPSTSATGATPSGSSTPATTTPAAPVTPAPAPAPATGGAGGTAGSGASTGGGATGGGTSTGGGSSSGSGSGGIGPG